MDDRIISSESASAAGTNEIRSEPCPKCILCGESGRFLYIGLRDRLFSASGSWNIKRCNNPACGIIWPDPKPLAGDIWKAYANYYTHVSSHVDVAPGQLKQLYYKVKSGYIANRYGYATSPNGGWIRFLGLFLYLFPVKRSDIDDELRDLRFVENGKLLDVGCGSGGWLASMNNLGWKAQGLDFDANAVATARRNGLTVDIGTLESQNYPTESFDAITLNHVIEHVPDPLVLLRECYRVLKPGGTVVLATPNGRSLGHSIFKKNWRGLEPPRHLQVLSPDAMGSSLRSAGFRKIRVRTSNSVYVWEQSLTLWLKRNHLDKDYKLPLGAKLVAAAMVRLEQLFLVVRPNKGECIAGWAVK